MKPFHTAVVVFMGLVLVGCGGNSDNGTPSSNVAATTTLTGVVIVGGNLQGATVCLDKNNNLVCEGSEPQTVTNAQGQYTLSNIITTDSANYAVIASIPVGATDETTSFDPPISKPYTLTAPIGKHSVISPITTIINEESFLLPSYTADQKADYVRHALGFPKGVNLFTDYTKTYLTDQQQKRLRNFSFSIAYTMAENLDQLKNSYSPTSYKSVLRLVAHNTLNEWSRLNNYVSATEIQRPVIYYLKTYQLASYLPLIENLMAVKIYEDMIFTTNSHIFSPSHFVYDNCSIYNLPVGCDVPYKNSLIYEKSTRFTNNVLWDKYSYLITSGDTLKIENTLDYHTVELKENGWIEVNNDEAIINNTNNTYSFDVANQPIADTLRFFSGQSNLYNNLAFQKETFPEGSKFFINHILATNTQHYALYDNINNNTSYDSRLPEYSEVYPTAESSLANITSLISFLDFFANHELIITSTKTISERNESGQILGYRFLENITATFSSNGVLHLKRWVGGDNTMLNMYNLADGSWEIRRIHNQDLLFITLPIGLTSSQYQRIYTVYNNQVVSGYASIDTEEQEGFGMNETAFNAFKSAIILNTAK
jgi:hypothetical protein